MGIFLITDKSIVQFYYVGNTWFMISLCINFLLLNAHTFVNDVIFAIKYIFYYNCFLKWKFFGLDIFVIDAEDRFCCLSLLLGNETGTIHEEIRLLPENFHTFWKKYETLVLNYIKFFCTHKHSTLSSLLYQP